MTLLILSAMPESATLDTTEETSVPPLLETDVLVVGTGPAGASAALFLATYGISTLVVTRERWTADTPRAHITNQRTMEILRDMELEERCAALAAPQELMANNVWLSSMAGEELGRTLAWGNRHYVAATPSVLSQ